MQRQKRRFELGDDKRATSFYDTRKQMLDKWKQDLSNGLSYIRTLRM